LGGCLATALLLALINLQAGISGDLDGHLIYERALVWGQQGLAPSRSWGFPAYEALVYPLVYYLGALAGKLQALAMMLAAVALFHCLAGRVAAPVCGDTDWRAATWATLALAVTPVAVISGNTLLETSQGLLLGIAALSLYARCLERATNCRLVGLGTVLGLATATRPDYALLAAAMALALFWRARPSWRGALLGAACYALCGLLPYALYWRAMREATVVLADPLGQRLVRAGVGALQLLGPAAWGVLAIGWWRRRKWSGLDGWGTLVLAATALYGIRFVLLPDELEYLLALVPLLLLTLLRGGAHARWSVHWLAALTLALALPNLVQVHLLAADAEGARYLSPGLSPGAIWQDRAARLRWQYVYDELPAQFDAVAVQQGAAQQGAAQQGAERWTMIPTEEPDALVIIPRDQTRFYRPERQGGRFWRVACSQRIIVYPLPSDRGWRQLTRYQPWRPITLEDYQPYAPPGCATVP
jgi:hypothetical protein